MVKIISKETFNFNYSWVGMPSISIRNTAGVVTAALAAGVANML